MTADIQPYRERHLQVSHRYPDDANPVVNERGHIAPCVMLIVSVPTQPDSRL